MTRVSIGLPFFNNRHTLADAIRSVFAQTWGDWELILVDDGSSDGSLELARAVADPRVRVVSDGQNKGLAARLNQIAHIAQGTYLARMDADDLMHPERLARQVHFLNTHAHVDVVGSGTYTIDANNIPQGVRWLHMLDPRPHTVMRSGLFVHPSVMGCTAWFRCNPYDEDAAVWRAEDLELWCRTCQHSTFASLPEPLLLYREGAAVEMPKYLGSCRASRTIFKRYGPAAVGSWSTLLLVIRSYVKGELFRAATMLGKQSLVLQRRNSPLPTNERAHATAVIAAIRQTVVPGLATPGSLT